VLLYRATRHNPPTEEDMSSDWDLGERPPEPYKPRDVASYKAVSTFDSLEKAAAKARNRNLGEYVAEIDAPDSVERKHSPESGHVELRDTTPAQLLGYLSGNVWRVDEVG
jgi:hypothetical protein